jgi:predicted RNA-binding Zn-ribbon protein involved in translation (DUF1610 family)
MDKERTETTQSQIDNTSVQYYFADDEYITWFECTNCKCNRIVYKSNYCPKCGKKITWKDTNISDLINKL